MMTITLTGRTVRLANAVILSAALALSGCAVAPTAQEMAVTQDECSRYRAPFTALSQERNARIANFAQIGAGVGAVVGQNVARNNNDNPLKGALLGALAGAALGATAGYLADLQKRATSTAGLQSAVNGDAARDLRETDRLTASMTALNQCRLSQIAQIEKSVRAGGDRAAATTTLRTIRAKVAVDNRVIDAVVGDLTRTRNLYIGALSQTGADTDTFVASIERYQPRVATPQRTALRVDQSQRPRTANPVANLGFAEKELSAGAVAHAQSIDAALADVNALLI